MESKRQISIIKKKSINLNYYNAYSYICCTKTTLMAIYSELEAEFSEPMSLVGLDFKNEYTKALQSFDGFDFPREEKYKAVKGVLQEILDQYSKTKPKTEMGKVGRFFAKILKVILPFIKFKRK